MRGRGVRRGLAGGRASRARASVSRTVQPSSAAARASRRRSAWSGAISSARPWPSVSAALDEHARAPRPGGRAGACRFETATRRAADAAADLLAGEPELVDEQRAGAGLLDRVEVLAGHVLDQRELERLAVLVRRDDRGHARPGPRAARRASGARRRSARRCRPGSGRTSTGCRTPRSLTDSDSASSDSSSKLWRGWRGFGAISSTGRRRSSGVGSPPSARDRRATGSRRGRGPSRAGAQPRAATSLASSK